MKRILMVFAIAAVIFTGCSKDKDTDVAADNISLSISSIVAGPEGKESPVVVKSTGDWRVSGVSDWARPSAQQGKNGETITFTIDPNTSFTDRETTFKVFTGSAVVPVKIRSEHGSSLVLLPNQDFSVASDLTSLIVKLRTNVKDLKYEFDNGGADWVSFDHRSDIFNDNVNLYFKMKANTAFDARTTNLKISGSGLETIIPLTQNQVNTLTVDNKKFSFDLKEHTFSFNVTSNVEYTVSISDNAKTWIIPQTTVQKVTTVTKTFKVLKSTETRSAVITLSGLGVKPVTIAVEQVDPDETLGDIPDAVFRERLLSWGYITVVNGTSCKLTAAGKAATSLSIEYNYEDPDDVQISSIIGLELFASLEEIVLTEHKFKVLDISKLKKVTSLSVNYTGLDVLNLGDNDITSIEIPNLYTPDYYAPTSFTVTSSKLETLELSIESWGVDKLATIDVSACPALTKLVCDRKEGVLKKIIFKDEAQKNQLTTFTYTAGAEIVYK